MGGLTNTNIELGRHCERRKPDPTFCETILIASNHRLLWWLHDLDHGEARGRWWGRPAPGPDSQLVQCRGHDIVGGYASADRRHRAERRQVRFQGNAVVAQLHCLAAGAQMLIDVRSASHFPSAELWRVGLTRRSFASDHIVLGIQL